MSYVFSSMLSGLPRFTLLLEPVEVRETVRKWGLPMKVIKRELRPTENVKDFLTFQFRAIMERIVLPERFDRETLSYAISERMWSYIQSDPDLKAVVRKIEEEKRSRDAIDALTRLFELLDERCKPEKFIKADAVAFLRSDLDLTFFAENARFYKVYKAYLKASSMVVRRRAPWLRTSRVRSVFGLFKKRFDQLKLELSKLIDHFEQTLFSYMALRLYIATCNASSYDEILDPGFISMKSLDPSEYSRLFRDFTMNLRESTSYFMSLCPEVFAVKIDFERPVDRMIKNIALIEVMA